MYKKFKVEHVGTPGCTQALEAALAPYQGNKSPIENIKEALFQPPLNVQSIVFEHDYIDADYQDEFSAFYAKSFKNYPQRCTRLHFFAAKIPRLNKIGFAKYRDAYRGFMVIRPTDLQRVGRTVLAPPIANSNTQFVHCRAPFTAHILGEEYQVEGMPFIQQDTQVGACAQACLWMVSRYMGKRYGNRCFLPSEVNALAKAKLGRGRHLPAEKGLTTDQMHEALHGMGLYAVEYRRQGMDAYSKHVEAAFPIVGKNDAEIAAARELQRTAKLADIAYRYIESGLPVILATHNHALVAIGHTYEFNKTATVAIQRIPAFIVNNDNEGCYRILPIFTTAGAYYNMSAVQALITITPPEVTLCGEVAEANAVNTVTDLLNDIPDKNLALTIKDLLCKRRPELTAWLNALEYRTYLMASTMFQHDVWRAFETGSLRRDIATRLIRIDFPKYVWVTEFSSPDLLNNPDKTARKCLGRVIVDSTAPANTDGVIALHFADLFKLRDRQGATPGRFRYLPNSTPYPHKLW